ncbi:tetratricopeptide repeat protein [Streptomyces flavofungini]|uniref:Tetratricopeptide repeat protein n=1 Tax=Streptomyces flavofungini TaxID=68200 RepID=A0ABS0X6G2_9ACTN|nr:tetratricopeptide repeat protein [Streptomyces flavofungini]MBJ3808795.1 tetratricopeptide repeat protein [Streptomyces flavofungini]GHC49276.1 hypothetical protein GCM10010349_13450 [Streptomyces flavofungini]
MGYVEGWLPDDLSPYDGPREVAELPPALRAFLRPGPDDEGPAILELYGTPGAGTYPLAVRLAHLARDTAAEAARFTTCWVPLGAADATPDHVLLTLLEQLLDGRPPQSLYDLVPAEPDGLDEALAWPCRDVLLQGRCLVVLDGLPAGAPGVELLRLAHWLVEGTDSRVLAVSEVAHEVPEAPLAAYEVADGTDAGDAPRHHGLRTRATRLLKVLARWAGDEVNTSVAAVLETPQAEPQPVEQVRRALRDLYASGLLQATRHEWYRLPPALRTEASPRLDLDLARAVLDGTADPREGADAYVDLVARLARAGAEGTAAALLDRLEPQLVGRQGLFRLLRLKQAHWHATGGWEPLKLTAAVSARETGSPLPALEALTALAAHGSVRAAVHKAIAQHHTGQLREAAATLDALPDAVPPDGWVLHTRAAVQCDTGELRGTERMLRSAVEAHQVRGDARGEAWAMHHYGRLRMVRGDLEEAQKRLEAARHLFMELGDRQGQAWTETELGRNHVLFGSHAEARHQLHKALGLHLSNGDVRGKGWTYLYLALAHEACGDPEGATPLARTAERELRDVPDQLGHAWAQHCRALLPFAGRTTSPKAEAQLQSAMSLFQRSGCPHGQAWNTLELARLWRREGASSLAKAEVGLYRDAERRFEAIGDSFGRGWAMALRASAFDLSRRPEHIPLTARHLVPEPGARTHQAAFPTTLSHIRLTLLDDESTAGTASRIALRVEPGPEHPWSAPAPDLPWLTARATPLTAADVEPVHAVTIRPSPRDQDGAEFLFTPRRAGRHRLLFTVEDSATATVLQQVETFIDVTDGEGGPRDALSPEALRRA